MNIEEKLSLTQANLEAIREALVKSINDGSELLQQQERDFETRLCLWDGQSEDGRKHREAIGKDPTPWEGASDMRIREADSIIAEQVDILKNAWNNASLQSYALRQDSLSASSQVNILLNWLLKVHLKERIRPEVDLFCQWRQGYGLSAMGIFWDQERRLELEEVDLQEMAGRLADEDPGRAQQFISEMESLLGDPLREEEALANLQGLGDGITRAMAKGMRDALLATGKCEFPKINVVRSMPMWRALRPFVDIFFPLNTHDIQRSPWVAMADWVTETELRDSIDTDDYDAEWVEKAIKTKGHNATQPGLNWYTDNSRRLRKSGVNEAEGLIQIFHVYYNGTEEKTKAPVMMHTIMHYDVPGLVAKHGISKYAHGKYPVVMGVRERLTRALIDSRSVAEIAAPVQAAIKAQFDSRTDATSIANIPPLITPLYRANTRMEFGPGCQHSERKSGELRWMPVPTAQLGSSIEIENAARAHLDRYFGRFSQSVPPTVSQVRSANLVEDFLGEMRECAKQTVQLAQQYLPEMLIERVTGGKRIPFRISRAEIQGEFDLAFTYDPRNMDMELARQKLKLVTEILSLDTFGITDRAKLVSKAMGWIDPQLAEELVGDPAAAAQDEVEDEKKNFSLIMAGVEPPMKEAGQNHQLRLQTLQQLMQENPYAAQDVQGREDRLALFENRMKHLQFMVQQQQNAATGRVGTTALQR